MSFLDGKAYRIAEILTGLVLLNLLWLVACIPVVTLFPATAAMFGVVREWIRNDDSACFEPFVRHLRANFAQSLLIGLVWTLIAAILAIDFLAIRSLEDGLAIPFFMLLALVTICYIFTTIYLFPVMVNYHNRWWNVIKNAFLIAISRLGTTLLCLLVVGLAVLILYYVPIVGLIAGSGVAYAIYFLCGRAFRRIEALKGIEP